MSILIKNVYLNLWKQFIRESGIKFFAHFVLSEHCDKVGRCSDISEVNIVVLSVSFQRPDNILEMNFGFMNEKGWTNCVNNWKKCKHFHLIANWGWITSTMIKEETSI